MPILNMVGFTALNTTFHLGFAFLRREQEEDYTWALSCADKHWHFGTIVISRAESAHASLKHYVEVRRNWEPFCASTE